jgi:putrescine transport system ATP-binding protein
MAGGRIVQLGTPQQIYEAPASRFVADFIGGINLFSGRVARAERGLLHVESAEAGAMLVVEHASLAAGSDVAVAVRPEKITLAPAADALNRLQGRVRGTAYRGEASTYEVELAGGKLLRVTLTNTRRSAQPFAAGQAVALAFEPAAAVVLPP